MVNNRGTGGGGSDMGLYLALGALFLTIIGVTIYFVFFRGESDESDESDKKLEYVTDPDINSLTDAEIILYIETYGIPNISGTTEHSTTFIDKWGEFKVKGTELINKISDIFRTSVRRRNNGKDFKLQCFMSNEDFSEITGFLDELSAGSDMYTEESLDVMIKDVDDVIKEKKKNTSEKASKIIGLLKKYSNGEFYKEVTRDESTFFNLLNEYGDQTLNITNDKCLKKKAKKMFENCAQNVCDESDELVVNKVDNNNVYCVPTGSVNFNTTKFDFKKRYIEDKKPFKDVNPLDENYSNTCGYDKRDLDLFDFKSGVIRNGKEIKLKKLVTEYLI